MKNATKTCKWCGGTLTRHTSYGEKFWAHVSQAAFAACITARRKR